MKKHFINNVEKLIDNEYFYDNLNDIIDELPSCYAKGWISKSLQILTDSEEDNEIIKHEVLEWATYDIWN